MPGASPTESVLTYDYDDSPLGTLPLHSPPPSDPGIRRPRRPRRWRRPGGPRLTWRRPHPARWLGDALLFLTAADRELIGSRAERYRYYTVALLMLLTAGQACYSGTLFMSIGLARPTHSVIAFGLFFAAAVLVIDRSIIGYAAPIKVSKKTGELAPPRKSSGVLLIRVVIAVCAAMLMSEMILLQVFAGDIGEQIQNNQIAAKERTDAQIRARYQAQIDALQAQIDKAQRTVRQDQADVNRTYAAMNCQEFGCPGIKGGLGPGYAAARVDWQNAVNRLNSAQDHLKSVRTNIQPQIDQANADERRALQAAEPAINNADKVLSREEAFWQLTVKNGTVAVTRLLLSLLILGIDLAPLLTKLTGRSSVHDLRAHRADYVVQEKDREDGKAAIQQNAALAEQGRQLHQLGLDLELNAAQRHADVRRAQADTNADVRLYEIQLDGSRRKLWAHHDYTARKPPHGAGGSGGPRGGNGRPADAGNGGGHGRRNGGARAHNAAGDPGQQGNQPGIDPLDDLNDEGVLALYHGAPVMESTRRDDPPAMILDPPPVLPIAEDPPPVAQVVIPDPAPAPAPEPDSPAWGWPPAQAPNVASIFSRAGREERSDLLVLDHRWVLYGPLPGADKGSGGIVWQARDRNDPANRWLVVKTVPGGMLDKHTAGFIQQLGLQHERRAAGVVSHNVGEILYHGDDKGFSYLVYPLYQPGSLAVHCERNKGRLTLRWCAQVIYEVLSGLIAASDHGLVHLDIKPGNIVMDGQRARVIDWGLSRKWDASRPSTWVMRGTPFFACPEQLIAPHHGLDAPPADLYAVGATFYWMLAGEAPLQYEAGNRWDLLAYRDLLRAQARPQYVHQLVKGVPRPVSELIDRWLSFDPGQRVRPGTPAASAIAAARDELARLQPALPGMVVGRVTGRRRRR